MAYDIKIKTDGTKVEIQNPFVDDYYTKVESDTKYQPIGDYVTESQLEEKGYITTLKTVNGESLIGEGDIVIQGGNDGYTKAEADAKFQPIGEYLTAIPDNYITEDELNSKGYITTIPDEYVTDSELAAKGYITEHQPLKTINGESLVGTGNITIEGSAPSNVVTTDTTQTITGQKEFAGSVIFDGGAEFHNEIRFNNGTAGDVDIAMGIACAFKVKPAQISNFYTYKIFPGNYGESDGKVHFRDFDDTTDYAVIDSTGISELGTPLSDKYQAILVSGTNIKTINGNSILGSGDITITGGGGSADLTNYYTKSEIDSMIGNISNLLSQI